MLHIVYTYMARHGDMVTVAFMDFFQLYHQVTAGNIMKVVHTKKFNTLLEVWPLV